MAENLLRKKVKLKSKFRKSSVLKKRFVFDVSLRNYIININIPLNDPILQKESWHLL